MRVAATQRGSFPGNVKQETQQSNLSYKRVKQGWALREHPLLLLK